MRSSLREAREADWEGALPWSPQPGPQTEAICADWCPELFYGGAAGGGKSDFLLGDFLQDVPTYGRHWRGILFRRTYGELEELADRAREIFPQSGATWHEQSKSWTWPNGAMLRFRYLDNDKDATRYQGHAYTWIGWDELTQWPTDFGYKYLRGRLRSAHNVPTKRIRAAANPGGVGHHWVKAYFVAPWPAGLRPIKDPVLDSLRMFVPARLMDNKILLNSDPGYANRLKGLASDAMVRAWLEGDWDVVEGAFFDCWSHNKHVIKDFTPPREWTRFRSMDWGSAKPFSIGWWAIVLDDYQAEGMEGKVLLPRGALVRYREWYGRGPGINVGLKLPADRVATGMVQREKQGGDPKMRYAVADPAIFKEDGGPSIGERINTRLTRLHCTPFHAADNSRIPQRGSMGGWDQVRMRMIGENNRPMIYCVESCADSIRTVPALQHDPAKPEDVNTEGEDHAGDDWRYACMSRPFVVVTVEPPKVVKTGYSSYEAPKPGDWLVY